MIKIDNSTHTSFDGTKRFAPDCSHMMDQKKHIEQKVFVGISL